MKWNSNLYDEKHSFVAEYGKALIDFVNIEANQKILDVGCGTGMLTNELTKHGATVIGTDLSEEMINKARKNYPNITFQVEDATRLPFKNEFDTVFSNAAFHWILNQDKLLQSIFNSLKDKGKLICEFGAKNNIKQIQTSFIAAAQERGCTCHSNFFLPSKEEYKLLLEKAGFEVKHIIEYDRPTPLTDGKNGLHNWINQFFANDLSALSPEYREAILSKTEQNCKSLWVEGKWIADYRRLQVIAIKA